jgi:hypothetical protein
MLEIFLLITLTKKNVAIAEQKGMAGGLFGALTVILWILSELTTAFLGFVFLDVDYFVIAILAFVGGLTGGLISFAIVNLIPEQSNVSRNTFTPSAAQTPVYTAEPETSYCRACGATVILPARFCDTCGAKIEKAF